jgi:phage tail-like protein
MAGSGSNVYPPVGFRFSVKVVGITSTAEGSFQEVSGLTIKIGTEEVKEGGQNAFIHRLPTLPKFENLVLKRGMFLNSDLVNWAKTSLEQFTFTPKTIIVNLLDEKGSPLAAWNFANAYPVSIKVSDFKAQENAIAIETFELAYDYFKRVF